MRSRIFALIVPGMLFAAAVAAQDGWSGLEDPLVTDRPDFTESTSTIPRGHYQIEGGTTLTRVEDADATSFGELLVRIGTGERWETRLGLGSFTRIDTPSDEFSGIEDPFVGIKVRFTEDPGDLAPGQPAASLILSTSIPAGDDELTDDEWVPEAKLALAWELTTRFSLSSNLNYNYAIDGGERLHQIGATLSGSLSLTDRLGAYLEWFGFSEETQDGPSTHYLNGGVSYLINNDLRVDARIGTGLNDADPDWFVGVGGGVRF
ncbi:MAG TPA: transporter [Thermoanaerobaculia bacterium]|nr:transporter [Thermoanaerobaculia bacterium]